MSELKSKRAPAVDSNPRAWSQVYDDINDIIKAVNNKSGVESRDGASGKDGDIRLFKDVDRTKYFIEGKFGDGWAKRELIFSDTNDAGQDESINFSATESYVKPDGSVSFTGQVIGVSPAGGNTNHLATKGYVDGNATAFELTGNVTGGTGGATAVVTTIANNTISQAKMLDDSVGTAEILNSNVTYAKLQNVSATDRVLGRNSSGAGVVEEITPTQLAAIVAEASSAGDDADMFLAGTGVFREPSFSTGMHGLTDTIFQSLSDGDLLAYYSPNESTTQWKNYTRASIVRPQISSSDPISYNNSTGVISHATGAGKNHIPSGGGSGEFLKYSSSGVAVWATPSYTTNTHRDIHTSPNSSATTISISSSWAHAHDAAASAHHTRYSDIEAVSAVNDTTSISTTCDSPDVNHHVQADWNQGSGSHAAYINNKPTIHYTSAVTQTELRNTLGNGNLGLVPDTGNSGEFLSYNGTFDEISVSLTVLGLSDTAFNSLSDGDVLYKDGSYWKNLSSTGTGSNARSASPTFSGTLGAAGISTSGRIFANKLTVNHASQAPQNVAFWLSHVYMSTGYDITWANGNATIGESSYNLKFSTYDGSSAVVERMRIESDGDVHCDQDVIAYSTTIGSDRKLKTNIVDTKYGLNDIVKLRGVDFDWNRKDRDHHDVGFIAQEVKEVIPELVKEVKGLNDNDSFLTVDYAKVVPILVESIKTLKKEIEDIKNERV
jgi:hypothetical protein